MSALGGPTNTPGAGVSSMGFEWRHTGRHPSGESFQSRIVEWNGTDIRAFNESVELLRRDRTDSDADQSLTWIFGSQDGETIMARLTDGIADGTSALQLPGHFARQIDAMFPVQCWRQPTRATCLLANQFARCAESKSTPVTQAEAKFDLHRFDLDVWRDRLEDFVTASSFTKNSKGLLQRADYPVLYRVDHRSPLEIVAQGGFHADISLQGIEPMIEACPLIVSCSLKASGVVLQMFDRGDVPPRYRYQYAIESTGAIAASWLENFSYLQNQLPDVAGNRFDIGLDEVHVDASAITLERIFIIGSDDPFVMQHLVEIHASAPARSVFGVSVKEFCERFDERMLGPPGLSRFPLWGLANSAAPVTTQPFPTTRLMGSHLSIEITSDERPSAWYGWCNWLCA